MYTKKVIHSSLLLASIITGCFSATVSYGQTYYSKFADPTGHAYVINPSGATCTAPSAQDSLTFADSSAATFTSFKTFTTKPFVCSDYHFLSNLNLPADTPVLSAGFKAGFRIRVPSGISLDTLRKYTVISTYTSSDGKLVESRYNENISGSDSNQNGVNWYLYFVATKPFNTVEINVDPNITPLNSNFEFDVLYAFASKDLVLPATIANFKASVSGKNVALSFQSLTETNVASYRIERSNNGGTSYTAIGSLTAKGNSTTAITYNYTDNVVAEGSYLYRVVVVNKDGTTHTTNSVTAIINGQIKLLLYPSVVKAGQNITMKTSETGNVSLQIFDAQGRLVKYQHLNSTGQLSISTSGLTPGIYVVKFTGATGTVFTSKFVVN